MSSTITKSMINGLEEVKNTYEKREGRFFFLFKTTWWEKVSTNHIGNDIMIETDRPIRNIYLNGNLLTKEE